MPWEPSANVTLMGDAIHVMSPSGGVGAVTALRDAALLSNTIYKLGILASSIGEYEATMRGYAQESIERSYFGGKKMFGQRCLFGSRFMMAIYLSKNIIQSTLALVMNSGIGRCQ